MACNKILLCLSIFLLGCANNQKSSITDYFDEVDAKKILAQVVRHNYYNEGIPASDRYHNKYNEKYEKVLANFSFYKYGIRKDKFHYFILYRLHHKDKYRATGGRFKLGHQNKIVYYNEIFVTPLLRKEDINEKADFLFDELIKTGEINDEFLKMRQYVEWPNETQKYDSAKHEWGRFD
ncbi:MAG: hypothetical protein ACKO96_28110 [Flammeovirgaceae bacterium]